MSWAGLSKISPAVNWAAFAKISGENKTDTVIVGQPEFYAALSNEIKNTPLPVWKNYLRARLIHSSAPYLDSVNFNNRFEYGKNLSGATIPKARWKRVLDAEESVKKAEKRYNNAVDDGNDLEKRRRKIEDDIAQNKKDQEQRRIEVDRQKQALEAARNRRKQ